MAELVASTDTLAKNMFSGVEGLRFVAESPPLSGCPLEVSPGHEFGLVVIGEVHEGQLGFFSRFR